MDAAEQLRQLVSAVNAGSYLPPDIGDYIVARRSKMPKVVKLKPGQEFTVKASNRASVYPWDEWLNPDPKDFPNGLIHLEQSHGKKDEDDNVIEVTKKLDYETRTDWMVGKIKWNGRKRYIKVDVFRNFPDGKRIENGLIIRPRPMDEAERREEDKKRAEAKARKAAKSNGSSDDDDEEAEEQAEAQAYQG